VKPGIGYNGPAIKGVCGAEWM